MGNLGLNGWGSYGKVSCCLFVFLFFFYLGDMLKNYWSSDQHLLYAIGVLLDTVQ